MSENAGMNKVYELETSCKNIVCGSVISGRNTVCVSEISEYSVWVLSKVSGCIIHRTIVQAHTVTASLYMNNLHENYVLLVHCLCNRARILYTFP